MAAHLFKLIAGRLMMAINERFQEFLEDGEDPGGSVQIGRYVFLCFSFFLPAAPFQTA